MTNTRITDPEIMERRYPVVLRQFAIRDGSGGRGQYNGGDGVIRDIEFLPEGIQVSILSERRVFRPYGMHGGEDAQSGRNLWIKSGGGDHSASRTVNLGGKVSSSAQILGGHLTARSMQLTGGAIGRSSFTVLFRPLSFSCTDDCEDGSWRPHRHHDARWRRMGHIPRQEERRDGRSRQW